MTYGDFGELTVIINVVYAMLGLALVLAFIRLVRGPSLPDRVVALDLIASLVVAFVCSYAIATNQKVFLDVAIVLALIAFLGTIAFAQYVERRARDEGNSEHRIAVGGRFVPSIGIGRDHPHAGSVFQVASCGESFNLRGWLCGDCPGFTFQ